MKQTEDNYDLNITFEFYFKSLSFDGFINTSQYHRQYLSLKVQEENECERDKKKIKKTIVKRRNTNGKQSTREEIKINPNQITVFKNVPIGVFFKKDI